MEREELLSAIRAASEEGARKALAGLQQEARNNEGPAEPAEQGPYIPGRESPSRGQQTGSCALFAEHGSEEARRHVRHHDQIGRYFAPFVKKAEGLAVTIASWAFWVVIVAGVLVVILLAADVKPFSLLKFHVSDSGVK